ncbi:hypothetical protein [Micromonospora sp. CPCC 206061]|uniref:hypothetical protein n=1 Tax=Micromonospora sp. CPCC 206061 TaxID=3122410 RepID=UPI002FEF4C9D
MPVTARLGVSGVLVEPTSVLVKAWERIVRIAETGVPAGRPTALISGAGALGLLAALLAVRRGYQTYVLARRWTERREALVGELGAVPVEPARAGGLPAPDVVLDTTGAPAVVAELVRLVARNGVVCLAGFAAGAADPAPLAALIDRLVSGNLVLMGTVNAARHHYEQAASALAGADPDWLARLITRRVPLPTWPDALRRGPDDVKVVVDLTTAA